MWTLLSLLACGSDEPEPTVTPTTAEQASEAVADIVCRTADQAELACSREGATVTLGSTALTATAEVVDFVATPPRDLRGQVIPGEVQLTLSIGLTKDGIDLSAWTREVSEAVGRPNLEEAKKATLEAVVQTWAVASGLAMIDALAQTPGAPSLGSVGVKAPAQTVGSFQAWAAHPVLKSANGSLDKGTAGKLGPSLVTLLAALTPFTEGLDPAAAHSIEVKAHLNTAEALCSVLPSIESAMSGQTVKSMPLAGDVWVNGQATNDVCALVESVSWPRPSPGTALLWDQYVALMPTERPAAP